MKNNNYKNLYLFIILVLFSSCGFKPISSLNNYKITKLETLGEKRINYILKSKLVTNRDNYNQRVELKINTKKNKSIKEKNIKNEISKYTITVSADVTYKIVDENKGDNFSISISGDFEVDDSYSLTITNEKNLIRELSNEISDEISRELLIKINDL